MSITEASEITKTWQEGHHQGPRRVSGAPLGCVGCPLGCLVAPLGAPFGLYLAPTEETPNIDLLFPNSSLYRRRRRFKIGAARRSCPTLCWKEEPPPGDPPSPWTPPGCVVSSPPWTMGP